MKNDNSGIVLCSTLQKPPKNRLTLTATVGGVVQMPSGRGLLYKDVLCLHDLKKDGVFFQKSGTVGYGKMLKDLKLVPGDIIQLDVTVNEYGKLKSPSKVKVLRRKREEVQKPQ